ncbi:MAG: DUF2334 domain-containing protein [Candidatus Binatia bacterium]
MIRQKGSKILVVFRNDDLSACSDVAHERAVAALFDRYGVPQTIGVIPRCTIGSHRDPGEKQTLPLAENPDIVTFLREYMERSGSEIALHGYSHQTNRFSHPARREFFEFRRLSLVEQTEKIRCGTALVKDALGVRPETFIPPWDRLDYNTLIACRENKYRIVSAGPFTLTFDGMMSVGADCSLTSFPELWARARQARQSVFLRVLYHSATTRQPEEIAALEHALQLATCTEDCEVLTLREVVRRYPEELRQANEAARNIVPQDEVVGSTRARAVVYRRAFCAIGWPHSVERDFAVATETYKDGRYNEVVALSAKIERACQQVVFLGRSLAALVGTAIATLTVLVVGGEKGWGKIATLTTAISPILVMGIFLWWYATALDTKGEIRSGLLTSLAVAVVAGLLLWR